MNKGNLGIVLYIYTLFPGQKLTFFICMFYLGAFLLEFVEHVSLLRIPLF